MNMQNVNQILDALGQRFGATGAHLWAILVRQVYVDAYRDTAIAVLLGAALYLLVRRVRREWDVWGAYDDRRVAAIIAISLLTVVTAVVTVVTLAELAQLMNPEYGALSIIFNALKQK